MSSHISHFQTSQGIRNDLANGKGSDGEVDIFSWATAAALELVGEAGLGYSFNSFTGERSEYNIAIKSVVLVSFPFLDGLYRPDNTLCIGQHLLNSFRLQAYCHMYIVLAPQLSAAGRYNSSRLP